MATSRRASRQLVTHGHFMLNGRRVDVPSIRLKAGDVLNLREHSQKNEYFKRLDDLSPTPSDIPSWLKVDRKKFVISITGLPSREEAEPDINEQLIVEYYSR
jgi:small subunit ribosomal protein S4